MQPQLFSRQLCYLGHDRTSPIIHKRAKAEPQHFKPEQLVHGNERSVLFVRFATLSCLFPLRTLVENKLIRTCESQIKVKNPALFN